MDTLETTRGELAITEDEIQIKSSYTTAIARLFRDHKVQAILIVLLISWGILTFVLDHWAFPAVFGGLLLFLLAVWLVVRTAILKLAFHLPTSLSNADSISTRTVTSVEFERSRFGPPKVKIEYVGDDTTEKERVIKLTGLPTDEECIRRSRDTFERYGVSI